MTIHQRLLEGTKKVAGRKAGACGTCGGVGNYDDAPDGSCSEHIVPCPTCAKWREIASWEWYECSEGKRTRTYRYCSCGERFTYLDVLEEHIERRNSRNPTFTVQSIRQLLENLGEWEKFVIWNKWQCYNYIIMDGGIDYDTMDYLALHVSADILTSDTLLAEATAEYLKSIETV